MNRKEKENRAWDIRWKEKLKDNKSKILESRFAKEAYNCIKSFITEDDKNILEAGMGTGRFTILLARDFPNSKIVGIDTSENAVKLAEKIAEGINNVIYKKQDLFNMRFKDNSFDVVFNEGVIEHFNSKGKYSYQDALKEMIRVTKKGGKVIVGVPNWYCLPHTFYKWILPRMGKKYIYGYEKSFRHGELIELFKKSGLNDIEISAFFPAHSLKRLSGSSRIFKLAGNILDRIKNKYFIKKFGFEIVTKGTKN